MVDTKNILIEDLCVWRFGRLKIDFFSSVIPEGLSDDIAILQKVLNNSEIVSTIPTIDRSITPKAISRAVEKISRCSRFENLDSRDRRFAAYLYDLAVSSLIRHDTGAKGSLSLFSLGEQKINYTSGSTRVLLPGDFNEDISLRSFNDYNTNPDFDTRVGQATQLIEQFGNQLYSFDISFEKSLSLSSDIVRSLYDSTLAVGRLLYKYLSNCLNHSFFVPFSVDFMFDKGTAYVLEVHVPPRGIELQFYGFRPFFRNLMFPSDNIIRLLQSELRLSSSIPKDAQIRFCNPFENIGFFVAERQFLEERAKHLGVDVLSSSNDRTIDWYVELPEVRPLDKTPELQIPVHEAIQFVDNRTLFLGASKQNGFKCVPYRILSPKTWIDPKDIVSEFGAVVACKELTHHSWWHPQKRKVKLLNLNFGPHQESLKQEAWEGCIVERVLTDSIDDHNHHGELKILATITNVSGDN